jgi:hypothetical protein
MPSHQSSNTLLRHYRGFWRDGNRYGEHLCKSNDHFEKENFTVGWCRLAFSSAPGFLSGSGAPVSELLRKASVIPSCERPSSVRSATVPRPAKSNSKLSAGKSGGVQQEAVVPLADREGSSRLGAPRAGAAIQLSLRYSSSRIACLRASLTSPAALRSSASIRRLVAGTVGSREVHAGQTLAKPGLSGFNSNSSAQTEQIFVGKAIGFYDTTLVTHRGSG